MKRLPLFFILVILCISSITYELSQNISASDYEIYSINGLATGLSNSWLIDNYIYILNVSYIYKYEFESGTLSDNINLGSGASVISSIPKFQDIIIYKYSDGGITKYGALNITSFSVISDIEGSYLTNYNGYLENLAFLRWDGKNYWGYQFPTDGEASINVTTVFGFSTAHEPLIYAYGVGGGLGHLRTYIYNCSNSVLTYFVYDLLAGNTAWVVRATLVPTLYDDVQTSISQMKHFDNIQSYKNGHEIYMSCVAYGVREHTMKTTWDAGTQKQIFMDLTDKWFLWRQTESSIRTATFTSSLFGSVSEVTLQSTPLSQVFGGMAVGVFKDNEGFNCSYVAYIKSSKLPTAEKIVGTSTTTVGLLPSSQSPNNCRVFKGLSNFMAIYTKNADTKIYVCKNLIESSYIEEGGTYSGEIIPQLYKCYYISASENIYILMRWVRNASGYPVMSGNTVYIWVNGSYDRERTTDSSGKYTFTYGTDYLPVEHDFLMNTSGYTPQWFNLTWTKKNPFSIIVSRRETPMMEISGVNNEPSKILVITVSLTRFTGEEFNDDYFGYYPKESFLLETTDAGGYYTSDRSFASAVDDNGERMFSLSYFYPYAYTNTFYYNLTEQTNILKNVTNAVTNSYYYNTVSGNFDVSGEGGFTEEGEGKTQWEQTTPADVSTTSGMMVMFSNNIGFFIVMGFTVMIMVGAGKMSSGSVVITAPILLVEVIGFAGYTGLIPLPIFIFVIIGMCLALAFFVSKAMAMHTGESLE